MANKYHDSNKKLWEATAEEWGRKGDRRGLWKRCHLEPELVLTRNVLDQIEDVSGKRLCVDGSGDNQVVFAFAGMGAEVTSVDISQNQLDIAEKRSKILGLEVSFQQADVLDLSVFRDESFDIVYTGGCVAVWVSDLDTYYREAVRILRLGGRLIVDEHHPIRNIWEYNDDELNIAHSYQDNGPFRVMLEENILSNKEGEYEAYEFQWKVSDFIMAVLKTGAKITEFQEYGDQVSWEQATFKGLPEMILIFAEK